MPMGCRRWRARARAGGRAAGLGDRCGCVQCREAVVPAAIASSDRRGSGRAQALGSASAGGGGIGRLQHAWQEQYGVEDGVGPAGVEHL